MSADVVTTRWATALFNLAKRQGALSEVAGDVERLRAEAATPAVRDWLLAASQRPEDRLGKIEALIEGFHPLTRNFVRLALDKRREPVLVHLGEAFHERLLEEAGAVEGIVESAHELPRESITQLAGALGKKLGKRVQLEGRVAPELVAGVRIFVGSQLIDCSVQGRLDALRTKLFEARMPAGSL